MLAQVQPNDPRFLQAVGLLSEVFIRLERHDLAIQRLAAAVPRGSPIRDQLTAELAYRLGKLLWEQGQNDQARQAFELVRAFSPTHKDVVKCLDQLSTGGPAMSVTMSIPKVTVTGRPAGAGIPASTTSSGRETIPSAPATTDPFAALDGNPFAPRAAVQVVTPPAPAETVPVGFVTRMEGYEVLKKLAIFEDLSLDEMKAFYSICDQVFYKKGDTIIEQGRQGEALVIVREGSLTVSKLEKDREITLATIPAGNYVGEMSLIDDGPTSARVTAAESVKALRIRRDRFEQFLLANDRIALRVYRRFLRTISTRLRDTNQQMATKR
jgi:hypothetical protein